MATPIPISIGLNPEPSTLLTTVVRSDYGVTSPPSVGQFFSESQSESVSVSVSKKIDCGCDPDALSSVHVHSGAVHVPVHEGCCPCT